MTTLLLDSSILIKWLHEENESEVAPARAIGDAHGEGRVDALILDLAMYEVGNVMLRSFGWRAVDVTAQLDDLLSIFTEPVAMAWPWIASATELADEHRLTFYDACWAAAARGLGVPLVSADRRLLAAGLATTATAVASDLRLPH